MWLDYHRQINKRANTIVQKLKEIGLSLEFLRGQGCDGGTNMSGKYHGVQARILNLQPKAIYTHCASHRLNLTLIKVET
ncbi:zinc finger MYM-type protein 1-like isoform X3 [Sipha flava]|uniref:Zinc finger MYM-type protein 1-like isoform X3 n=1 Tax=Sipha flava TaxID=143950 RepID=A0A8B8FGV7_9HEMI|nr:zinc finger MYM-type protein 1-like isoform X3 [Sipha flava]